MNVRYVIGIDHLRGVAALLMVAYHGMQVLRISSPGGGALYPATNDPISALIVEGHTAVALFMVLSGFILTYGADRGGLRYGAFMKNRVLRVLPMYVLVLFVGIYALPGEYTFSGFTQFFTLQAVPPLATANLGAWSAVLWTISVEFSFYLLFPFLLRFLQRYGVRYLLGVLLLTNTLRLLAAATERTTVRDVSYWTIVGRIDQFVIGMLGAWLLQRGVVRLARWQSAVLAGAGVVAVCCALWWFNRHGSFAGNGLWKAQWPLIEAVLWGTVVVGYVGWSREWSGRLARGLTWPGVVSYSVYLLHFPIVSAMEARHWQLVDNAVANAALLTAVVMLPVTLLLATVSYLVVERPFMEMRVRYLDSSPTTSGPTMASHA